MAGITLLTPTGGRPQAFALCERFMSRQSFQGDVQWLAADDYQIPTVFTMREEVVRITPWWTPRENTQHRNLLALIPLIRYDRVLIIEDDDWYAPNYLSSMADLLDQYALAGYGFAHYYNVATQLYRVHHNNHHASLCQTGFRMEVLDLLTTICKRREPWIDIVLWSECGHSKKILHPGNPLISVGIKGLPGRPGVGRGHQAAQSTNFKLDQDFSVLPAWIGADAELYQPYRRRSSCGSTAVAS